MKPRILVVDDEESILRTLAGVLEDEGFEVLLASTGEEGLERIGAGGPDVVLLDVWLPGIDGLAVLEAARQSRPELPVLVMSGHASADVAARAAALGARAFLEKPLDLENLLAALEDACRAAP